MKTLTLLALAIMLGGCETTPVEELPGYLGESDLRSMGGSYEYEPTIQVIVDEPEIDYDRLYRKWEVQDRHYGRDPRRGKYHGKW